MSNYAIGIVVVVILLIAAIPYVACIRHASQKPLAAYLIFVSMFAASAAVIASVLAWLAGIVGLAAGLDATAPALLFLALIFLPALAIATWQARKPPWRQNGPPD
ncbi:MAG TPA: hypothetical protein VET88_05420 [Gammaproteobacteria bacterium]|nr:hypothetical protein [Gammaproteobacteria bacterium]